VVLGVRHVRLTPDSDRTTAIARTPGCSTRRLTHCTKEQNYSITPAAVASSVVVGGTPFRGVPIKPGATYGITARDGEALDEQRKFGGRVTIDQGRIYR
jgi:hypothetical protein